MENNSNLVQIVMPISTNDLTIVDFSLRSILDNEECIKKCIFIIEEHSYNEIKSRIISTLEETSIEIEFAISNNNSTKLEKLKKSSKFVIDDLFVIVLDEDDYLIKLNDFLKDINIESDLILSSAYKWKDLELSKLLFTRNHDYVAAIEKDFCSFFDNFNTLSKGNLFKKINDEIKYDFQRFEGIYRSILYISRAKKIEKAFLAEKAFLIWTKHSGRIHMSEKQKVLQLSKWIENLIENLWEDKITFSNDVDLWNAQISGLLRIFRTAISLNNAKLLDGESIIKMEKIFIIANYKLDYEKLFERKKLFQAIDIFNVGDIEELND